MAQFLVRDLVNCLSLVNQIGEALFDLPGKCFDRSTSLKVVFGARLACMLEVRELDELTQKPKVLVLAEVRLLLHFQCLPQSFPQTLFSKILENTSFHLIRDI